MNFQRCYELIGLVPGCSWEELQTGYRRQVQKWHPDRYEQDPEQQQLAAQRMLELNEAYAVLSEFNRQYGYLPAQPATSEATPAQEQTSRAKTESAPRRARGTVRRPQGRKTYAVSPWLLISAILLGVYFLIADLIPDDLGPPSGTALPTRDDKPAPLAGQKNPAIDTAPQSKAAKSSDEPESTFTYGDLPGWVYEVEGIPTKTSGDLWFYGTSEVLFADGKVVSWYSSPDHPLKVRGNSETLTHKPSETSQHNTP